MSLLFSAGFDSVYQDTDLKGQGWFGLMSVSSQSLGMRSTNGFPGRAVRSLGSQANGNTLPGAGSGTNNDQYYHTNRTVKQLWDAGGFTLGGRLKFNETGMGSQWTNGTVGQVTNSISVRQIVTDGTKLWALRQTLNSRVTTTSYELVLSTDAGLTWTVIPFPNGVTPSSTVVLASPAANTLWISDNGVPATFGQWMTTNDGSSWTQGPAIQGLQRPVGLVATGNATYPWAMICSGSSTTSKIIAYTEWSTSATAYNKWQSVGTTQTVYRYRVISGRIVIGSDARYVGATPLISAWTAANESGSNVFVSTSTSITTIYDIALHNGNWIIATNFGLYYAAASGAMADNPAGTNTAYVLAFGGSSTYAQYHLIQHTDGKLYSTGTGCSSYTNPDATPTNWVPTNTQVASSTQSTIWPFIAIWGYSNSCKVGNQYIMVGFDGLLGALASMPNFASSAGAMILNLPDPAEGASKKFGFGVHAITAGSLNTGAATFTLANATGTAATSGFFVSVNTTSGGANAGVRNITLYKDVSNTTGDTVPIEVSQASDTTRPALNPWHYYEIMAIKDPATANSFFLGLRIDGAVVIKPNVSYPLALAADTTSTVVINSLQREYAVAMADDVYLTDYSGTRNAGPIGPLVIARKRPVADVQADWDRVGAQTSNAASVSKAGISQTDNSDYVTTTTDGDIDIYQSGFVSGMPSISNLKVRAVQAEVYAARGASTVPQMTIGITSGASVAESATLTVGSNSPTFLSQIFEEDPNGNVAWTPTTATNARSRIKKIGT